MKPGRVVTTTRLVEEALRRADDFRTAAELVTITGRDKAHVAAALAHLHNHRAVDFITQGSVRHWFPLPADWDTRARRIEEIIPDAKRPGRTKANALRRLRKSQP